MGRKENREKELRREGRERLREERTKRNVVESIARADNRKGWKTVHAR